MRTACALMVMPRSRSRSMASRICACISRPVTEPVNLQQTVAQRRLAVVDVGNDGEIAKEACVHAG